jgi:PrtD family type I secretion system ABC transporter
LLPLALYAGLFSFAVNLLLLVPPLYMLQVFDRVLTSRHAETLVLLTLAAAAALLVMSLLDVLRSRLLAGAAIILDRVLGPQVIERLVAAAARGQAGEHAQGLRDVSALRGFLTGGAVFAAFDAPWLPLFLLLIALFHPLLGWVALGGAVLLVALALVNARATRESLEAMQRETRAAGRFIDGALRNAEAIRALAMLHSVTGRWQGMNDRALAAFARTSQTGGTVTGLTKLARQAVQIAMLGAGAYLVLEQHVTPGVMMAATIILGRALAPVESLIAGWRSIVDARQAYRRLDELLGRATEPEAKTELPEPRGALSVEAASFRFPAREALALRNVTFALQPGETLGLIGPSASGKSTLARLLVGLWKPLTGSARLDGADLSTWPRPQLARHVGYLPQDVELFAGTVAENIARLGDADSAAVVRAAQRARCHEMILRLPRGYEAEMGEAGAGLSPGQRQRVALARALLGEPKLVVLDEPNANLDGEGEEALLGALRDLKTAGVTVVLITHRPSLLVAADKLLVLRDGAVEMFGPPQDVIPRVTRGPRPVRTQGDG